MNTRDNITDIIFLDHISIILGSSIGLILIDIFFVPSYRCTL